MLGVREGLGGWVAGRPDRVVLEMDAPYLAQRGEAHVHSPFMVREWVLWLCKLWNLPLRVVTEIVECNFQTLYQVIKIKQQGERGGGLKKGGEVI